MIVLLLILMFGVTRVVPQLLGSYKAAVLEYTPVLASEDPASFVIRNAQAYRKYMEQAAEQGAQIIVLPEDGLTGLDVPDNQINQDEITTEVPDPSEKLSPCFNQRANFSKFFIDLSCAAHINKIYTVINLIEKRYDNNGKVVHHNTNVVFDKNGAVIARYRKINLFGVGMYEPGPKEENNIATFETDFGVTFGMFICFDIVFKTPALDVLASTAVTDIVYSVAWFSELPYFTALSVQHGYAKSNGVNLLAAGLNNPNERNGGSGIYLADGRIAQTYISGTKSSKLILHDVPIIKVRKDQSTSCQAGSSSPKKGMGFGSRMSDINLFKLKQSNLTQYTFQSLNTEEKTISETVCSTGSNYCCNFNITMDKNPRMTANYVYKLAVFNGVMAAYPGKTIGIRACGVVSCLNEDSNSCGERHSQPPSGISFESISISSNYNKHDSHVQPSTLNFDLTPVTEYTYCTATVQDNVEVTIFTTKSQDSLLTFGIVGRAFDNDDKPEGLISHASSISIDKYCVFLVTILAVVYHSL